MNLKKVLFHTIVVLTAILFGAEMSFIYQGCRYSLSEEDRVHAEALFERAGALPGINPGNIVCEDSLGVLTQQSITNIRGQVPGYVNVDTGVGYFGQRLFCVRWGLR